MRPTKEVDALAELAASEIWPSIWWEPGGSDIDRGGTDGWDSDGTPIQRKGDSQILERGKKYRPDDQRHHEERCNIYHELWKKGYTQYQQQAYADQEWYETPNSADEMIFVACRVAFRMPLRTLYFLEELFEIPEVQLKPTSRGKLVPLQKLGGKMEIQVHRYRLCEEGFPCSSW